MSGYDKRVTREKRPEENPTPEIDWSKYMEDVP